MRVYGAIVANRLGSDGLRRKQRRLAGTVMAVDHEARREAVQERSFKGIAQPVMICVLRRSEHRQGAEGEKKETTRDGRREQRVYFHPR